MQKQHWLREGGQVVLITALLVPVMLGMAGMAVDIGSYASERRSLQNAADSIALAAAQELPDEAAAVAAGETWAAKNSIDLTNLTITVTGGSVEPKVTASINDEHEFAFIRILGVSDGDVSARAAATKNSFGGGAGIVPWSVTQDTVDTAGNGALVTMKYDATGVENGNFGAIRIDGPGSSTYNTSVKYGSGTVACAVTAPNCVASACPGTYPSVCAETSPECDGPECDPQTGNMVGPTRTGTDFRMTYTSTECDSFEKAFPTQDANGVYDLNPDCNPWLDGPGKCDTATDLCSRRVLIIPVIDDFGNGGSDPVTLQRFALVYLEGYESGKCSGDSCEIMGHFVKADVNPFGLAGSFDPTALIHFVRLAE